MPWKESCRVSERMRFITRLESGERMSDLCREFQISRKTGYKLVQRWKTKGPQGLFDESRKPVRSPHRVAEPVVKAILKLKAKYPTWGAKKLRAKLASSQPGIRVPAQSTIHLMLEKRGLVKKRKRRRPVPVSDTPLAAPNAPNELWCADFKGQFQLQNGKYCYPLTITDNFSRSILACIALENTRVEPSLAAFRLTFEEFGLPQAIRTDNGVPFATTGIGGLTKLSAFWVRLGIKLQRITPGKPQQNGCHERMHLTLKRETTRPSGLNVLQQQERFDKFVKVFNEERPHEAIGQRCPAHLYHRSQAVLPELLPLKYPLHDRTCRVYKHGHINFFQRKRGHVYVGKALVGENVGLRELVDGSWLMSYADLDLGYIRPPSTSLIPIQIAPPSRTRGRAS